MSKRTEDEKDVEPSDDLQHAAQEDRDDAAAQPDQGDEPDEPDKRDKPDEPAAAKAQNARPASQRWLLLGVLVVTIGLIGGGRLLGFAGGEDDIGGCGGDTEPGEGNVGSQTQALSSNDCLIGGQQGLLYGQDLGGFCCFGTLSNGSPTGGTCSGSMAGSHSSASNVCALDETRTQGNPVCECRVKSAGYVYSGQRYGEYAGGFCCLGGNGVVNGGCSGGAVCALDPNRRQGNKLCACPDGWNLYADAFCCSGSVSGGVCSTAASGGACALDDNPWDLAICTACPSGWTRYDTNKCCQGPVSNGVCQGELKVYSATGADGDYPKAAASCPRGLILTNDNICCDGTVDAAGDCVPKPSGTPLVCKLDPDDPNALPICGCPVGTEPYGGNFSDANGTTGKQYCCYGTAFDTQTECYGHDFCVRDEASGYTPQCNTCPDGSELYAGKYCCSGTVSADGQSCLPQNQCDLDDPECRACPPGSTRYGTGTNGPYCCTGTVSGDNCISGTACTLDPTESFAHCDTCPAGTTGYGVGTAKDYCCDGVVSGTFCNAKPPVRCALDAERNPQNLRLCATAACPEGWTAYGDDVGGFCCKGNCDPDAPNATPPSGPKASYICALDPENTQGHPVCRMCPDGWTRYGDQAGGFCCMGAVSADGMNCLAFTEPICTLKTQYVPDGYRLCQTCQGADCDECPAGMTKYGNGNYCCAGLTDGNTCQGYQQSSSVVGPVCALDPDRTQGNRVCNHCPAGWTRYADYAGGLCCSGTVANNSCTGSGAATCRLEPDSANYAAIPLCRSCPEGWTRYGNDAAQQYCCGGNVSNNSTCDSAAVCALTEAGAASSGLPLCTECPAGWTRYADEAGGFCCHGDVSQDGNTCANPTAGVCALSTLTSQQMGNPRCDSAAGCGYDRATFIGTPVCHKSPPMTAASSPPANATCDGISDFVNASENTFLTGWSLPNIINTASQLPATLACVAQDPNAAAGDLVSIGDEFATLLRTSGEHAVNRTVEVGKLVEPFVRPDLCDVLVDMLAPHIQLGNLSTQVVIPASTYNGVTFPQTTLTLAMDPNAAAELIRGFICIIPPSFEFALDLYLKFPNLSFPSLPQFPECLNNPQMNAPGVLQICNLTLSLVMPALKMIQCSIDIWPGLLKIALPSGISNAAFTFTYTDEMAYELGQTIFDAVSPLPVPRLAWVNSIMKRKKRGAPGWAVQWAQYRDCHVNPIKNPNKCRMQALKEHLKNAVKEIWIQVQAQAQQGSSASVDVDGLDVQIEGAMLEAGCSF